MFFKRLSIAGAFILSFASGASSYDGDRHSNGISIGQAALDAVPYVLGGVAIVGGTYGAYSAGIFASETLHIPVKSMLSWGFTRAWQGSLAGTVIASIPAMTKTAYANYIRNQVPKNHDASWLAELSYYNTAMIALIGVAVGAGCGATLGGAEGAVEGLIRSYLQV